MNNDYNGFEMFWALSQNDRYEPLKKGKTWHPKYDGLIGKIVVTVSLIFASLLAFFVAIQ